jgi:hypothetical protein
LGPGPKQMMWGELISPQRHRGHRGDHHSREEEERFRMAFLRALCASVVNAFGQIFFNAASYTRRIPSSMLIFAFHPRFSSTQVMSQ